MLWKTALMRRTTMFAYDSPLGPMTLAAEDGEGLPAGGAIIGVWFDGQRRDRAGLDGGTVIAPGLGDDGAGRLEAGSVMARPVLRR